LVAVACFLPGRAKDLSAPTRINGNSNTKSSAYMSLARPILEYGTSCWEPYTKDQTNPSDRVQKESDKFANHTNGSGWETLAQRRKIARICSLFKAYAGEGAWKSIEDRLKGPCLLSRDDHDGKITYGKETKNWYR
jgi:hypothetical protein